MAADRVTLFLAGDVMTGRGIDQALAHPGDPRLYEPAVHSAKTYLALAEARNGALSLPLAPAEPWGDLLAELDRVRPDLRIVNLETGITTSDDHWPGKAVHYRMHPANLACLTAARLDCAVLANNHVLDWGRRGLEETLDTLHAAGIATAGAGRTRDEAAAPAALEVPGKGRVLVFGLGAATSGIPPEWKAEARRPGINRLGDLGDAEVRELARRVEASQRSGDVVVASIHWGPNWGYRVSEEERRFGHRLIDECGVDIVHGHSSHHPKGIEVYRERPVLYGAGDLITDYEGIEGYERFRGDLSLAYFASVRVGDGSLAGLETAAFQMRRFRLNRPSAGDAEWLGALLRREGEPLGTRVDGGAEGRFVLRWGSMPSGRPA